MTEMQLASLSPFDPRSGRLGQLALVIAECAPAIEEFLRVDALFRMTSHDSVRLQRSQTEVGSMRQ